MRVLSTKILNEQSRYAESLPAGAGRQQPKVSTFVIEKFCLAFFFLTANEYISGTSRDWPSYCFDYILAAASSATWQHCPKMERETDAVIQELKKQSERDENRAFD